MSNKQQKQPTRVLGPGAVGDVDEPELTPEPHLISDEVLGIKDEGKK